jgi:SAM-dependent methyltransferase
MTAFPDLNRSRTAEVSWVVDRWGRYNRTFEKWRLLRDFNAGLTESMSGLSEIERGKSEAAHTAVRAIDVAPYIDLILCAPVVHHLNIPRAMQEMRRLLKPGGAVIMKEPVRFSTLAGALRKLFPAQQDVSDDEPPLTLEELRRMKEGWHVNGERAFRLPMVPLVRIFFGEKAA